MGMEALIHGCEVVTYGWNFYAGWGLTTDRGREPLPPRARQHSVIELFQACYIDYAHYYDPDTLEPCDLIEDHGSYCPPETTMGNVSRIMVIGSSESMAKACLAPLYSGASNQAQHERFS